MRLTWRVLSTWESAIQAATYLNDNHYPSKSPTPAMKMCGCTSPTPVCMDFGFALSMMGGTACTAPPAFDPYATGDGCCPARMDDWKPAHAPQVSRDPRYHHAQQDGTTVEVLRWLKRTLVCIAVSELPQDVKDYALALIDDLDQTVTLDTVEALGSEIVRRADEQKPWGCTP